MPHGQKLKMGGEAKNVYIMQQNVKWTKAWWKFRNFSEIGGNYTFCGNRGKYALLHNWLRGMGAPAI